MGQREAACHGSGSERRGLKSQGPFKRVKEFGFYPRGHKKPLKGFKKGTNVTSFTFQRGHSGSSVSSALVKGRQSRETREGSSRIAHQ